MPKSAEGSDSEGEPLPEADYEWLREQLQAAATVAEGQGDEEDDDDAFGGWHDPSGGSLTELLEAVEQGDVARAQQLLGSLPVDVNTPGPDGDTALHLASLYGHLECARMLLENGADANVVNEEDGSTALHDAAASGHLEICNLILAKANPDILAKADDDGDMPLHNAARGNNLEVVRLLLSKGADPHAKNKTGNTPAEEADEEPVMSLLNSAMSA